MLRRIPWLLALLCGVPAAAGTPWLAPGDAGLRRDVDRLAAAGLVTGPVNAWPLPVAQVCDAAEAPLRPALAAARRRVDAACRRARGAATGGEIALATAPVLLRGFAATPRARGEISAAASHDIGRLQLTLGAGLRGGDAHIEPSFAALDLGGWALYGGYVGHWWGPGRETALLLSTNAAPFPKVGVRRLQPQPIDLPLLRALGPVSAEAFVGVLTERRDDHDNPALIGMRVAIAPAAGLEIGFNRALQLCGAGRPCSPRLLVDGLIGFGNRDNSGTPNEPGNQLAGADVSYRRSVGPVSAHLWAEFEAEDENNLLVEQFARLAGAEVAGALGTRGAGWTLHVEAVDTLAVKLFGSKRYPGSFYNHSLYTEGFRYRHRALGSSLDGDGRMLAVAGSLTDSEDRSVELAWRTVDLNRSGTARNPLTDVPVSFDELSGAVELPALAGRLRLEARVANGGADTIDGVPRAQLAMSFRLRR